MIRTDCEPACPNKAWYFQKEYLFSVSPGLNALSEEFFTPAMKCFPHKYWPHFELGSLSTTGAVWRACQVLNRQGQAWEAGWAEGCVLFEAKHVRAECLREKRLHLFHSEHGEESGSENNGFIWLSLFLLFLCFIWNLTVLYFYALTWN